MVVAYFFGPCNVTTKWVTKRMYMALSNARCRRLSNIQDGEQ